MHILYDDESGDDGFPGDKKRLAVECAKLDVRFEQALADEGLKEDSESWPIY